MKRKDLYIVLGFVVFGVSCGWGGYLVGVRQAESGVLASAMGADVGETPRMARKINLQPFDLEEAKREIDAAESQLERYRIVQNHLERWVAKDPVDALDWLSSQQSSYRKGELIRLALKQYSETDGRGAARWALKNLKGNELNNSLIAVANEWALQNGREAAEWFLELPDTPERDAAVENMMFVWGTNEPKAALGFVNERSDLAEIGSTLRRASLAGWAKSDPQAAVAASLEVSKKEDDPGQFANTLANWATVDLKKSSDWLLGNLEEGRQRTVAAAELGVIFAQQSPEEGVAFLKKLSAGEERDAAGNAFAAQWAEFGAKEAAQWAVEQKTIKLNEEAAAEIAVNYLMSEPEGYAAWKSSLPPGPLKDAAEQVGQLPERGPEGGPEGE